MEDLLRTSAIATVFGVSPRTLIRWVRQGVVRPDRVTPEGECRWSVASLDRQLDALCARSPADDG